MALFDTFRKWESRYALTFMGFAVGVIGIAFAVYTYFQKTTPNLRMEVVSSANVIDVKEDVGNLEILFNGVNLRKQRETLALVTLKLSNDGASPIRLGDYDARFPLGINIGGGEIARADILRASDRSLEKGLRIQTTATNAILSPVIIEAGDAFWLKLLVLHSDTTSFSIGPIGKIAGIKEIAFVALNAKKSTGWLEDRMHIPTVVVGGITGLILSAAFFVTENRANKRNRAIRQARVEQFRPITKTLKPTYEGFINFYVEFG